MAIYLGAAPANPIGVGIGSLLGTLAGSYIGRRVEDRDRQKLSDAMAQQALAYPLAMGAQGGMMANQLAPPPVEMPNFVSSKYRNMADQYQAAKLQGTLPLNPLEEAERQRLLAQADLYGAQAAGEMRGPATAAEPKIATEGDGTGLSPGTVWQFDRYGKMDIIKEPPSMKEQVETDVLYQNLADARADAASRLSPAERKAVSETEANIKKVDLMQKMYDTSTNSQQREKLGLQIEDLKQKVSDPIDRRIRELDDQMRALEDNGQQNEPIYKTIKARFDELSKLKSSSTTVNVNRPMTEGMVQRQSQKQAFIKVGEDVLQSWDPSYTGPIQGRFLMLKNRLGGGTEDQAKFEAKVTSLLESMYQRAGKQLSDEEIRKWRAFLPRVTQPDNAFVGTMENLIDNVASYLASETSVAERAGYNISGTKDATAIPTRTVGGVTYQQKSDGNWYPVE